MRWLWLLVIVLFVLPSVSSFCQDSDNGKNFDVQGGCVSSNGYSGEDTCIEANMLREYYCKDNDTCWFYDNPCECSAGKCINGSGNIEPDFCFDSDNGRNTTVAGVCIDKYGAHYDRCYSNISMYEWYCLNGRCAVNMNRDFCPEPLPETKCSWDIPARCRNSTKFSRISGKLTCTESDNKLDVYNAGFARGLLSDKLLIGKIFGKNGKCSYRDSDLPYSVAYDCCMNNTLMEAFCDKDNIVQIMPYYCKYGCSNGKCIKKEYGNENMSGLNGSSDENTGGGNGNVWIPIQCPNGEKAKKDLLTNDYGCCLPDECLADGVCVQEWTKQDSWMCYNGRWQRITRCRDFDKGKNFTVKAGCISPQGYPGEDFCMNDNVLREYFCLTNDSCWFYDTACMCSNGRCVQRNSNIPIIDKDVPCYDTDKNNEYPDGKNWYVKGTVIYKNEHTGYKLMNFTDVCVQGRNDFNLVEGICVKGKDGFYEGQVEFNCPHGCKDGACIKQQEHFDDYTNIKLTNEQLNELGCCMNPITTPCDFVPASVCCPDNQYSYVSQGEFEYTSKAGPRNQAECYYEFFYSWPDNTACQRMPENKKELCSSGCCCSVEHSDKGDHIIPEILDKIDCRGGDRYWIGTNGSCDAETCSLRIAAGNYEKVDERLIRPKIEDSSSGNFELPDNELQISENQPQQKLEMEECQPGECKEGLHCLKEFDNEEKMICCADGKCATQGDCLKNGFEILRNGKKYICQDSKWVEETIPENKHEERGCSFVPGMKEPPDFGFVLILMLCLAFAVRKFWRIAGLPALSSSNEQF